MLSSEAVLSLISSFLSTQKVMFVVCSATFATLSKMLDAPLVTFGVTLVCRRQCLSPASSEESKLTSSFESSIRIFLSVLQ